MKYKKPQAACLNLKEEASMASSKRECSERGCCVKSLRNF